jgi:hypothetical protein
VTFSASPFLGEGFPEGRADRLVDSGQNSYKT